MKLTASTARTVFADAARMTEGQLIQNGIKLWEEEARSRPLFKLRSLDELPSEFSMTDPEAFRILVLEGGLVPISWKRMAPYPYRGLLISAVYFLAAMRAHESKDGASAWGLIVQAYYYLGTNSSPPTAQETASAAATARHEKHSGELQNAILDILSSLSSDPTVTSIAEARRRVCAALIAPPHAQTFHKFCAEGLVKDESKTAVQRLEDLLAKWSLPKGGHPEVSLAFGRFKRTTRVRPA